MPDLPLHTRSGLEHITVPGRCGVQEGPAGVTLSLREGVALASVMVRRGMQERLAARIRAAFALDLPATPRRRQSGAIAFAWAGPGRWLAMTERVAGHAFEQRLHVELAGLASICDQSSARTLVRIGGKRARDTLAKGAMVDLHPRVFGPGDAAVTVLAHIGAHFWQLDAMPTYEFAVSRSLGADFWRWLVEAGAEYGVEIESGP